MELFAKIVAGTNTNSKCKSRGRTPDRHLEEPKPEKQPFRLLGGAEAHTTRSGPLPGLCVSICNHQSKKWRKRSDAYLAMTAKLNTEISDPSFLFLHVNGIRNLSAYCSFCYLENM